MNLPPLRNPWTLARGWARANRAKAEILAIAGLAIGMIVVMSLVTLVVILRLLR
jgi:hypothetical protein